jgi:hypothetical protein
MEWWRLLYFIAVIIFVGYSIYSYFDGCLSLDFLPTGIMLLAVGLLIYIKK